MRIKKEGVDGPLRGLFGPISRQIMNAIETISHKNNVSKRARIRLDCLYIAYIRSCMVAAGKHQLRMDFVSKKSRTLCGPRVCKCSPCTKLEKPYTYPNSQSKRKAEPIKDTYTYSKENNVQVRRYNVKHVDILLESTQQNMTPQERFDAHLF